MTTVDFHFDPLCPFAYQTSVWIRDVRAQLGITINWRFFSLEEINLVAGKKHPWEARLVLWLVVDADRCAAASNEHVVA